MAKHDLTLPSRFQIICNCFMAIFNKENDIAMWAQIIKIMWWFWRADHSFQRILISCSQSTEFTQKNNLLRSGWESNYLFTDQLTVKSLTREGYFATVSQSGWAGGGGQLWGEDQLEGSVELTRCEDTPGKVHWLVRISFWPEKMFKEHRCDAWPVSSICTDHIWSKSCSWCTGNSFNASSFDWRKYSYCYDDDDDIGDDDNDNDNEVDY